MRLLRTRRGTAAVEMMLMFPPVVGFFALVLVLARCGLAGTRAEADARVAAWSARPGPATDPLDPGRLPPELVKRSAAVPVAGLPPGLGAASPARAEASAPVAAFWDDSDVPLSGEKPFLHPSPRLLNRIPPHGGPPLPRFPDLAEKAAPRGVRHVGAATSHPR
jgi:hypothetical protein